MVCRENKARSAVIGLEKHLLAQQNGGRREPDHVFQSSIHEYGHAFEGVNNPTREEYEAFLTGFRQQVVNSPSLTDAEKYRESDRQPGIVTRIDQEIERVRSGKDEKGRPLRPEQLNGGKHFASMQRMSTLLNRQVAARNAYVENYARQTGISVGEAQARWDSLCARSPQERENTQISLRDGWQRDLQVAGLTSQHQADMMQSNVARDAVKVMEHERRMKVATLPSRATITPEKRTKAITTEQASGMVKCEACGQFGHEDAQCPHDARLDDLTHKHIAAVEARKAYEDADTAVQTRQLREELTGEAASEIDQKRQNKALEQARKNHVKASRELEKAQAAFEQARGPVPIVSDAVTEIGYDRDSGTLEVTRPGYTRKSDGQVMPPKRYYYRMSPDQYDDMMASDSVGKYLASTVGSPQHESFKHENRAEALECTRQRQCPTCGQWASMTSAHQCPTPGSMDSTEEAHWRERVRQTRERAAREGMPAVLGETTRRRQVLAQSHAHLPAGGVARFPEVSQMTGVRDRGEVGTGPVTVQYFGATVTGKAHTWKDPRDGTPYTTMSDLSCSCQARETCSHREHAGNVVAAAYRSQRLVNARPGSPNLRTHDDGTGQVRTAAVDAPDGPIARRAYERIRQDRAKARDQLNEGWAGHPEWRPRASAPLDAATGDPVPVPRTYRSADGNDIDVSRPGTGYVAAAMQDRLSERSDRPWAISPGSVAGTSRISTAPWRRDKRGHMSDSDRRELGRLMGLRGMAPREGLLIPDEPSSKYEMLARSERGRSDIHASRFVADKGQAYGPEV